MKLHFKKGEVKELPPKGILPWNDIKYKMKDRTAILLYESFRTPSDLYNMIEPIKPVKSVKAKK